MDNCIHIESDEMPMLFNSKIVKSRKEHICCECAMIINKNSKYLNESGLWSDGFKTFKTCLNCKSIRDLFFCSGIKFEYMIDNLKTYIQQNDICSFDTTELTDIAKKLVFKIIDETILKRGIK